MRPRASLVRSTRSERKRRTLDGGAAGAHHAARDGRSVDSRRVTGQVRFLRKCTHILKADSAPSSAHGHGGVSDPPGSQPGTVSRCARGVAHAPSPSALRPSWRLPGHVPTSAWSSARWSRSATWPRPQCRSSPGIHGQGSTIAVTESPNAAPGPAFVAAFASRGGAVATGR